MIDKAIGVDIVESFERQDRAHTRLGTWYLMAVYFSKQGSQQHPLICQTQQLNALFNFTDGYGHHRLPRIQSDTSL
ncbi:hypothetical protein D0T25_01785 [Duganella sp. BJB488]|nr:hypothetical protein D0T26_01420 [Duganella sp. BJB489]RFP28203.1 hypothetical protein D0T25_01785 [Duganella sp. BJB488]RFP36988.1 hypothetical protein D0T24_09800 [Duganella sp. BJB480]